MSTYYQYRDVKVMMAHKLMAMDGWKVYGYHADNSDPMTDYFDPASWGGVAEKNGYVLVVDRKWKEERTEIREYTNTSCDSSVMKKIAKLSEMTVERGASEAEEKTAKEMIEKLTKKNAESAEKYVITGYIPGHMENPSRCNWHIEKDGVIIAKGTGLLKYADVYNYYSYPQYTEDLKDYRTKTKEQYIDDLTRDYIHRFNDDEKAAKESATYHYDKMKKDVAMIDKFEKFINKIDTTCGGLLGNGDGVIYEKIKVTEYKKENKAIEDKDGSIKEGQCFIVKSSFNYGHNKGYVYRIHETKYEDGSIMYHAYKLNGKKTKECTGTANSGNYWFITDNFIRWFEKGALAWCHIEELKTPYEVEKVIKKVIKAGKSKNNKESKQETTVNNNDLHYEISEDTDTRTGEKIYLVKVTETLSREEYINVNKYIKSIGGYYSRFKHAFLFKENPTDKLNNVSIQKTSEPEKETVTEETESKESSVEYEITEDIHTKTGKQIWIVKPKTELNKADFADVKRKLAILQGFYSTFKHGFIFNYNPTEKLQPV